MSRQQDLSFAASIAVRKVKVPVQPLAIVENQIGIDDAAITLQLAPQGISTGTRPSNVYSPAGFAFASIWDCLL